MQTQLGSDTNNNECNMNYEDKIQSNGIRNAIMNAIENNSNQ